MADQPFSWDDHTQKQLDPFTWAKNKALKVFLEIRAAVGDEEARRVFAHLGATPSAAKMKWIEKERIRDQIEVFGRSRGEIARELARLKHGREPTVDETENEKRQLRAKLNGKPKPVRKTRRGRTKVF